MNVSSKRRSILLLAIVLVAALVIGLATLLPRKQSAEEKTSGRNSLGESTGAIAEGEGVGSGDSAVRVESASGNTYKVARPRDALTPPSAGPEKTPADEWQQYLDATKAIVENNESSLTTAIAAVTAALQGGDSATLEAMLAPDEGATGYGDELANRYPTITGATQLGTINVFSSGQTTLYFAYVLVQWQDAGIASQHTIPVAFRYVNGQWVITVLGEGGPDRQFVQAVTL